MATGDNHAGLGHDHSFTIPKLTLKNYNGWMVRVKSDMLLRECWEAICGYEDVPQAQLSQVETRKRVRSNLTALSLILRSVSDELITDVMDCESAKEAWDTLDRLCNDNSLYGSMLKLRELTHLEKTDDLSVTDYCSQIVNLNRVLKKNNIEFSDKQLAGICLTGLPDSYEILIKTLTSQSKELTMAVVKKQLLEHEEERKRHCGENSKHQALKSSRKGQLQQSKKEGEPTQKSGKGKPRRFWCYACGGEGHIASKCPKHDESTAERGEQKKATATVVTREHVSLCAKRNVPNNGGVWLLDCGASDHMTNRRDLIHDFEEMHGVVEVGDGAPLQIAGKGKVTLQMSDQCGGKDIELKEVLLVPELQDNLISQGQIEEKGLKIEAFQGLSRILMGDKMVFQAHRVSRLYYVTTLNGVTIKDIQDEYSTRKMKASRVSVSTWHSRLKHPNVKVQLKLDA
jgi:gag-polypeptide of LTR copia-type/Zinc knuckle